jgi:hypothetical protein
MLMTTAARALHGGDIERARLSLETVLREHAHEPEAPEAALQLGLLLSRMRGRPEAARRPLMFAARLHPDPARRAEAILELERLGG